MDVLRRQTQEEGLSRTQTEGKRLFVHYCVTCHGERGEGDGQNAYNLDPKPPNFRESLRAHPSSYWRQVIWGGTAEVGRSALCPPRGRNLSAEEIDGLLAYLGVTLVLWLDTHSHRPSRITQTSVYRNVSSARCPCLLPTKRNVNHTTAVSRYTLTVNSS